MSRVLSLRRSVVEEAVAERGLVVAKQPPAALAGLEILERGGNAVDAAVAASFASGVVLPLATGVGGGGYIVFHDAGTHRTHVIDYALQAPASARPDMYTFDPAGGFSPVFGWREVVDEANRRGPLSMAVPGNVAGLGLALERFGTMTLAQVLEPAIRLAEDGFPLSQELANEIVASWKLLSRYPTTVAVLTDAGRPYAQGEVWRNPALARTLKRIAARGAEDFYHGETARELAQDLADVGSIITAEDLARYAPRVPDAPLSLNYRDVTIHCAPGATGSTTMLETLKILEAYDVAAMEPGSPELLHLWIEASRLAFADRFQYLADPEFIDVPLRGLLASEFVAERRTAIRPDWALRDYAAGDAWAYEGRPRPASQLPPSRPFVAPGTSHLGVVDAQRNVVSLTDTLVGWSGVALPRTGIIMNNGMMWFDPEPGHSNSIEPHKRGVNNMSPAIVLKRGQPWLSVGARGGRHIIGTVAQVISNVVDHGMGIQDAITSPKIDCSTPATTVSRLMPEGVRGKLEALGHTVREAPGRPGAGPGGILIDHATGLLHGGEDPYGQGIAAGY